MDDDSRNRRGLRVLVVEDELLVAMEMEEALAQMGCVVLEPAPSVARALALLERKTPDLALLDVNLGRERSTPVAEALLARRALRPDDGL